MNERTQRNLITLLKIFKNRPYHLSKYLLDNDAFNSEFLKKVEKSFKLDEISNKQQSHELSSNFNSISQMDDFYNSLLDEMQELIVKKTKKSDISKELNKKLSKLLKDERYEEAAALRDYMTSIGIKRKNSDEK